ncbi:uncharacterized protein PV07_05879 [Cladophialophora immunda]|uniref:Uncharacterized protein n=1 Tax=Cladophialophora immunda TaxID=569365 RepID=A0A0D2CJ25_9EURO|nr:uncharacterized protein PV07_05879 [Cladophialophora immunda]KIW30105.1 hypothetical protein PV07_05879 [Cladophialophora immunda]
MGHQGAPAVVALRSGIWQCIPVDKEREKDGRERGQEGLFQSSGCGPRTGNPASPNAAPLVEEIVPISFLRADAYLCVVSLIYVSGIGCNVFTSLWAVSRFLSDFLGGCYFGLPLLSWFPDRRSVAGHL